MTTPKGYPCQRKEDRLSAEFVTIQPVTPNRFGLETVANCFAFQVATDTVDSSTTTVITAAAHSAIRGDIIRFTSGSMAKRTFTVWDTETNTITLSQTMDSAPAAGSAFTIMRYSPGTVSVTGSATSAITFTRNGAGQEVIEDTVTPANNRPLPVKLTDFSGDMVLNASNLNLEVQLGHSGANPDSVQIGNGTAYASFGAGANASTVIRTTPATDAPHLLATRHEAAATPVSSRLGNGTNFNAYDTGASDATTPRSVLATRHEAAATPISVRLSDGSGFPANGLPSGGRTKADGPYRNDYTGTSVTTLAYVQLEASSAAAIHKLHIFDSSGQTMAIATGAAGAEVIAFYIPPGGIDIEYLIPASTRISIIAISATASVGEIVVNALT